MLTKRANVPTSAVIPSAVETDGPAIQGNLCYVSLDDRSSEDNLVSALSDQITSGKLHNSRYVSIHDGNIEYFGQILKGPIYTPEWGAVGDGTNIYPIVSGDKVEYVPSYYGFVQIQILGEVAVTGERKVLQKTFHRPHPKSKIRYVPEKELLPLLRLPTEGTIMGALANYSTTHPKEAVPFRIEDTLIRKQLGIFGATGQGKSNTVLALAESLAKSEWCVIILDHSGEYTECKDPSEEKSLFTEFWKGLGVKPKGVENFVRLIPVTDQASPKGAIRFSVRSKSVPFGVLKSLLNLSPTQDEKLDTLRRELGGDYDGLPSLKRKVEALSNDRNNTDPSRGPLLRKIDRLIGLGSRGNKDEDAYRLFDNARERKHDESHPPLFEVQSGKMQEQEVVYLSKAELIKPSTVIVVDLGNTAQQDIINIVALDILTKLERAKASVQRANRTKVAIFIEEAHTFFSAEYTGNDQIARSLTTVALH